MGHESPSALKGTDMAKQVTNSAELRDAASDFVQRGVRASEKNDVPSARMYLGLAIGLFEEANDPQGASATRDLASKFV